MEVRNLKQRVVAPMTDDEWNNLLIDMWAGAQEIKKRHQKFHSFNPHTSEIIESDTPPPTVTITIGFDK